MAMLLETKLILRTGTPVAYSSWGRARKGTVVRLDDFYVVVRRNGLRGSKFDKVSYKNLSLRNEESKNA